MIKLDDNLLAELGLQALPPEEKKNLLRHIYETLELRVGTTLAQQMTDAQLDEFESFINNNDEAGALHWLETNFPNYKDVVAHEFELLKNEVRQAAPQILANAAAQPQQAPPAPMGQYPQPQPTYQQPMVQQPPQQQQYAPAPQQSQYNPVAPAPQPTYQQPATYHQQPVPQPQQPPVQYPQQPPYDQSSQSPQAQPPQQQPYDDQSQYNLAA